jgi:hypothetical protein
VITALQSAAFRIRDILMDEGDASGPAHSA